MLFGRKQSLVGLDIGSHTIKVVELEALSNKTYRLTNWGVSQPLAEAIVEGEIMDRQLVTDAISNLLESRGIDYIEVNLTKDPDGRAELSRKTGLMTFPQIVVGQRSIGGFRELLEADRAGTLEDLLAA